MLTAQDIKETDIRWKQRFENYGKSLALLSDIVNSIDKSGMLSMDSLLGGQMRYGLSDYTLATLENIFSKYQSIKEAILYGSRAMGNYKNGSDIDISLKTDSSFDFSKLLLISRDFYNSDMPYFVDVSIYDKISNRNLLAHIERYGKVLYASP